MNDATLPVSEVFGPVWQGEGPHTGRVCSFLRLGLCNLSCTWCDTPYTWDHTRFDVHAECPPRTPKWIGDQLRQHATRLLILSGGEPLIHQRNEALISLLSDHTSSEVHVETNGTLAPETWLADRVAHFTVSPKLAHGGDPPGRRLRQQPLEDFAYLARQGRAAWKVVVQTEQDVDDATHLFELYGVPSDARWLMPEGVKTYGLLHRARQLADVILASGANLTLRQHTLLYGTERGR